MTSADEKHGQTSDSFDIFNKPADSTDSSDSFENLRIRKNNDSPVARKKKIKKNHKASKNFSQNSKDSTDDEAEIFSKSKQKSLLSSSESENEPATTASDTELTKRAENNVSIHFSPAINIKSPASDSNSSSDEDLDKLRLFRNKKPEKAPVVSESDEEETIKNLETEGEIIPPKPRQAALTAAEIIKLKHENENLINSNLKLPKKSERTKLSLREFMNAEKNKLSTPKSETQENLKPIPKTENSGLTPSTQAARQARASMLKQWKSKIKNVIPKTPDNNLLSTSLVSFDLDDESRNSQQNQPLRPVDKLQKRLFQRSNSITSSQLSTNPEDSLSQNTSSNDSKSVRKHVDILVRTENPETKVVELVRETISVEDKPVIKKQLISSKEKLRSCLKKKIFKMKDQNHQERLKNHELKLEDYNKQFEGDDFEFDENEETMINSSSQKHNAQMTGSIAYTEESLSSHALDPDRQPLGPLWEESEVDDEMAKLLAPNSRSAAEVDNLTFV